MKISTKIASNIWDLSIRRNIDYNNITPVFEYHKKIPKNLHQIYISKQKSVPDVIIERIDNLRRVNNNWEYLSTRGNGNKV